MKKSFKSNLAFAGLSLFFSIAANAQWPTSGNDIYYNIGNVGIGTTTPKAPLNVVGANLAPSTSLLTGGALSVGGTGTGLALQGGVYGTGVTNTSYSWLQARHQTSSGFYYSLALNPLGGNVGIGTTTPSFAKIVSQPTVSINNISDNLPGLSVEKQTTATFTRRLFLVPHVGVTGYNNLSMDGDLGLFWTDGAAGASRNSTAGLVIAPWAGSTAGIKITSDGKVGVGVSNPLAKLDVTNGSVLFNGVTGTTPTNGAGTRMMWIPAKAAFRAGTVDAAQWDDANIGVGSTAFGFNTTAPAYESFVIGRYNYNLGEVGAINPNPDPTAWAPTDQLFAIGNGSKDKLSNAVTVYKDGKTLIGNPGTTGFVGTQTLTNYLLYVQKGILTEKVKVAVCTTANWADYVFEENYKLKTISELEAFVKTNKHLPNVPSAEDVVKEGIDMATMDAKLLEKIEELSLYIIEQNKRIEALENKTKERSK